MATDSTSRTRITRHAGALVMLVVGMVALAYASVPLYRMFCQITGFGGTTMLSSPGVFTPHAQRIRVRFNADTDAALPWRFAAPSKPIEVQLGENTLAAYSAENLSDKPVRGVAIYNVVPHSMGKYFHKIQCFCFEEQTLKPHERVNMPVSFVIDPAMLTDPETKGLREVTLSYTFFAQR